MSLPDELQQLDALRQRGVLSESEFVQAKARLLSGELPVAGVVAANGLRRSLDDRWIAGVCGGLARLTGAEAWLWRLAFALLFLLAGTGVLLYILTWIFVPTAPPPGMRSHLTS
ncbi:PspC domain-containing protein [Sphaerotilus mobilis]|uniref:Phage shock protein C (PspC) family protein n=1 Tax=Sphaerotilus mobilis TaxID=47994 RepID=A0A4V2EX91_9BURK|nr:PspC domain-containing protein [Sphaerotilus mobilis]RZS58670.1 phage shock protein C (PspC) family protein [Sphaerotilus mobilis]